MLRKILIFLALAIPFFGLSMLLTGPPPQPSEDELPWNVEVLDGGNSSVFGVTLEQTPLNELRDRLRLFPSLGLFVSPNGDRRLEAYFGSVKLGPFETNLLARLMADEDTLDAMVARSVNDKPMPSGARRLELSEQDTRRALELPVAELSYVPRARYDEQTVLERFGRDPQKLLMDDGRQYYLYPDTGVAILLTARGRDTLHFISPRNFDDLRARIEEGESLQRPLP
ncbi:hypothetical protein M911_13610 [Ectothiorhodospira haloalkaliphila]|uniref:Uncharacterized protein n=1 Tax=Ectothiorhodospira haloalkaliphila TaxID=421628 RepID=W8KSL7_9GAMM|nr:hypothetical protein [Ectothiorhodospira haloalkaliphila]AHK80017.1 hypothetical protein M911_13610 [Ectothiorhodospira haloalkaliphila]MCG5523955.1 hypothetical protein [Ectothiorhodospira haloalkaliphila]